jgi:hypothetical protein
MSVNRSVQAAQRRRAGPSNNEPLVPGRKPQPSINSAQMFANQSKSGPGPNIPTGRLAGQQEAMQQQQMQQQMHQQMQGQNNDKLSSVNKLTVAQAITLITLRLGSIESKLMHMPEGLSMNMDTNVDPFMLQSIHSRLESLEKRSDNTGTSDISLSPELKLIKQQLDTIKQAVVQNKNSVVNLVKENNILKTQVENLKKELSETKELSQSLEKITFENSESILKLSMNTDNNYDGEVNVLNDMVLNDMTLDELKNNELYDEELQNNVLQIDELQNNELRDGGIAVTNLKQMIESELRL